MELFNYITIFLVICVIYYIDYINNKTMRKQIKLMRANIEQQSNELKKIKRMSKVISTKKKHPMLAYAVQSKKNNSISDKISGIHNAPMYATVDDNNDNANIFLLNQINQKFNDTLSYIEPDLSNLDDVNELQDTNNDEMEDTDIPSIYNDELNEYIE
jgi:hypothetical protein